MLKGIPFVTGLPGQRIIIRSIGFVSFENLVDRSGSGEGWICEDFDKGTEHGSSG